MSKLSSYASLFVEGATTSTKAGANLCNISFITFILSAIVCAIFIPSTSSLTSCANFYDNTCFESAFAKIKSMTPGYVLGSFFYTLAAFGFISVGNCLENVFHNTVMARVLNGTMRLACIMIVFESCYTAGTLLQARSFITGWTIQGYYPYIGAMIVFMQNCSTLIWTLDSILFVYFLVLLSFLTSDNSVFSHAYTKWARVGAVSGLIYLICVYILGLIFVFAIIGSFAYMVFEVCLVVILGMTGRELRKMEGDLVGKKPKKQKKGKKSKQEGAAV